MAGSGFILLYTSITVLIYALNPAWREHLRPAVHWMLNALASVSRRRRLA
jgi:hypothetical protein